MNKVVLVTGANGGLGKSVTQAFLDAGATVVGTSREIEQSAFSHAKFTAIPADLRSPEAAQDLAGQVVSRFSRLDVIAHTVGAFAGGQSVVETDATTFKLMFDLNLYSLLYIAQAGIPHLRKCGNGRLIAIGSRAAVEPGAGVGAYSASKAAMLSLMKTIAIENRDAGVTANTILPGTMDTAANRKSMPQADFSKWILTRNVASLVLWLAGDAAKDVSGAALPIFGNE